MGKEDYRNKIIEIVNGIEDKNFLDACFFPKEMGHLVPLFLVPIGYVVKYGLFVLSVK